MEQAKNQTSSSPNDKVIIDRDQFDATKAAVEHLNLVLKTINGLFEIEPKGKR
jgi:hypothetical protein